MIYKNNKKKSILIYDSDCIFCSSFVKYLDLFFDKNYVFLSPLYITSPDKLFEISKITEIEISENKSEIIKNLSKDTIILISDEKIFLRTKAVFKLALIIRPNSFLIKILNNAFLIDIFSFLINPFYILFAKNRYSISKILYKIFPNIFKKKSQNCFISNERITFL